MQFYCRCERKIQSLGPDSRYYPYSPSNRINLRRLTELRPFR